MRAATKDDLPVLLELAAELREQALPVEGTKRGSTTAYRAVLAQRYCDAIDDPERHLVLAVGGRDPETETPLGMALFTVSRADPLVDIPAVHMSHAVVSTRHRKRGAGKALVAAAAVFAEERGIDQLVASVHPASREAARFFARLGFAPQSVRRTAPVSVVRRHLGGAERPAAQLVRRRPGRPQRLAAPGSGFGLSASGGPLPATGTDGLDS